MKLSSPAHRAMPEESRHLHRSEGMQTIPQLNLPLLSSPTGGTANVVLDVVFIAPKIRTPKGEDA
ncbi:unnamed protein product [Cyprideis torosa]|uniref:Uncharacterized protein n=1 Tax=Cyprideis torosa TaxID=163714 RepID=A0A7R8WME7_9CRUS|nr:unnamed protein product [Cyprideis torosa]CAG0902662.1 unnamed protein product [Cyprideis torosa]